MKTGIERLTKREFYNWGGFSNPRFFRKATRNGAWQYFRDNRR